MPSSTASQVHFRPPPAAFAPIVAAAFIAEMGKRRAGTAAAVADLISA